MHEIKKVYQIKKTGKFSWKSLSYNNGQVIDIMLKVFK